MMSLPAKTKAELIQEMAELLHEFGPCACGSADARDQVQAEAIHRYLVNEKLLWSGEYGTYGRH